MDKVKVLFNEECMEFDRMVVGYGFPKVLREPDFATKDSFDLSVKKIPNETFWKFVGFATEPNITFNIDMFYDFQYLAEMWDCAACTELLLAKLDEVEGMDADSRTRLEMQVHCVLFRIKMEQNTDQLEGALAAHLPSCIVLPCFRKLPSSAFLRIWDCPVAVKPNDHVLLAYLRIVKDEDLYSKFADELRMDDLDTYEVNELLSSSSSLCRTLKSSGTLDLGMNGAIDQAISIGEALDDRYMTLDAIRQGIHGKVSSNSVKELLRTHASERLSQVIDRTTQHVAAKKSEIAARRRLMNMEVDMIRQANGRIQSLCQNKR